jgi:hypothetical protein
VNTNIQIDNIGKIFTNHTIKKWSVINGDELDTDWSIILLSWRYCQDLVVVWLIKMWFGLATGLFASLKITTNYNHWKSLLPLILNFSDQLLLRLRLSIFFCFFLKLFNLFDLCRSVLSLSISSFSNEPPFSDERSIPLVLMVFNLYREGNAYFSFSLSAICPLLRVTS